MEETLKISLPTSWDDITVSQYCELLENDLKLGIINKVILTIKNDVDSITELDEDEINKLFVTLSIILDIDVDVINQIDIDTLLYILQKLSWLGPVKVKNTLDINFRLLTTGTWIDIETIITNDISKNIPKFLTKLTNKDVSNESITKYYGLIDGFLNYRKKVYEDFGGLFNNDDDDSDEDIKSSEELYRGSFNKKWNWYNFLYQLANENVLDMEKASELNMIHALNHFSFIKERGRLK